MPSRGFSKADREMIARSSECNIPSGNSGNFEVDEAVEITRREPIKSIRTYPPNIKEKNAVHIQDKKAAGAGYTKKLPDDSNNPTRK